MKNEGKQAVQKTREPNGQTAWEQYLKNAKKKKKKVEFFSPIRLTMASRRDDAQCGQDPGEAHRLSHRQGV